MGVPTAHCGSKRGCQASSRQKFQSPGPAALDTNIDMDTINSVGVAWPGMRMTGAGVRMRVHIVAVCKSGRIH